MPTIIENEDGKGSYSQNGIRLVRLDDAWAYDLWKGEWSEKWAPAPFRTSWYHKCLNSNMHLRCDYIKNINKYYTNANGIAQIQYSRNPVKEPLCCHCFKPMPVKYARLFQAYFIGERLRLATKHGFSKHIQWEV